ncbi:unnamed protein product [Meganyctiphanes norvegica]|uniref:Chitin-binding type-2 domain-containing protein n=1 Tax=Meganyctiphanes norvegica TaxID=48144 RepID=A0AAV2Q7E6_MEGNR
MVMATAAIGQDLQSTFKCEGRPSGFYTDVESNCQVFHVCVPDTNLETRQFTFSCGRSTVFSQVDQTCVHSDMAPPCQESQLTGDTTGRDFFEIFKEFLKKNMWVT